MRKPLFLSLFCLVPLGLWADDFRVASDVRQVILYPDGGSITRRGTLELPEGDHRVFVTGIPETMDRASLRVAVTGAELGAVAARVDNVPPAEPAETPRIIEARALVETREAELAAARRTVEAVSVELRGAQAQLDYLSRIGEAQSGTTDPQALAAIAAMIGEQTVIAERVAHEVRGRVVEAERTVETAQEALDDAQAALKALLPDAAPRALVALDLSVPVAGEVALTLTYETYQAGWEPTYDARLDTQAGALALDRGVLARQETGENWEGVALRFSTARPTANRVPGEVTPHIRRIIEPQPRAVPNAAQSDSVLGQALLGSAIVNGLSRSAERVEAKSAYEGLTLVFDYPAPVDLVSQADTVQLGLGAISLDAEIVARAVPLFHDRAYLIAKFTNGSGELLLPGTMRFFRDGTYVGTAQSAIVAEGEAAELAFGAIDGLAVTRQVLDRLAGDRGVITRSNEHFEAIRLTVENQGTRAWPIELIDRVSVSEQEDLRVTWSADRAPGVEDWEERRGVLAWETVVEPGARFDVRLEETLRWPEGMVLR